MILDDSDEWPEKGRQSTQWPAYSTVLTLNDEPHQQAALD